jgi:RHS repeat-associated protein
MHFYVSNGSSSKGVNFDDFMMTSVTGKLRQINHYYPYGLPIADIDGNHNDYWIKYSGKEHQTSEYQERGINAKGLEMFDFHARFWEPQLARWTAPDPAMQFSNPYLGIGNNPVMYVDPDGEFVFIAAGFLVGAYIGGAMANDHLNPGKWDFQDANTWIGMGVGGAIGAFGGHALGAAKGKAAFFGKELGSAAAKTAGKKFFGSTVGGMTNSISNYDGADDFGLGTLADFGSGFFGAYKGAASGKMFEAIMAGGTSNVISQGIQNWGEEDYGFYQIGQSFVGGALSSITGAGFAGVKAKGIFAGNTKLGKYANSFLNYGSQSTAYDFAYTKQSTFLDRSFGDHLGMFVSGGFYGTLGANAFKGNWGSQTFGDVPIWWRGATAATAFATDYSISALIKGRSYGNFYKESSQRNKGGIFGMKYLSYFANLKF